MTTAAELALVKARLLAAWDAAPAPRSTDPGALRFQALTERGPRSGLAIGHSRRGNGPPRLELRVTSSQPRALDRARKVEAQARAEGFDTVLEAITRPIIDLFSGPPPIPPLIAGKRAPLHLGCAVAHERGWTGSLGAFVRLGQGPEVGLLSCAHVLARRHRGVARTGDPIQHPGSPDPPVPGNRIGSLSDRFAPLVPLRGEAALNNVDAAVARLRPGADHLGNRLPDHPCLPVPMRGRPLGAPLGPDDLLTGTPVLKLGRMTGLTSGIVTALAFENLDVRLGAETYRFAEVHEVAWTPGAGPYSRPGDSGGLVMTEEGLRPVGLHFCAIEGDGEGARSYVVPWHRIAAILEVTFL